MRAVVGGVPVDALTRKELAAKFEKSALQAKVDTSVKPKLVFSMNGEGIYRYHKDKIFKACIDQADIVHADGMSVVRAGNKFTEFNFEERVATTDLVHDIAKVASEHSFSIYLLGAKPDVVERAASNLKKCYPNLIVSGFHHGYFEENSEDERLIVQDIVNKKPDIVFVGLGRPRQELWCVKMQDRLDGVAWLKTCGGLFDFLSGDASRAPAWMINSGTEWLYRMLREPRRLFWRYLLTNSYSLYCYRFKRKK